MGILLLTPKSLFSNNLLFKVLEERSYERHMLKWKGEVPEGPGTEDGSSYGPEEVGSPGKGD